MSDVDQVSQLGHHGGVNHANGKAKSGVWQDQISDVSRERNLKCKPSFSQSSATKSHCRHNSFTSMRHTPMTTRPTRAANHLLNTRHCIKFNELFALDYLTFPFCDRGGRTSWFQSGRRWKPEGKLHPVAVTIHTLK